MAEDREVLSRPARAPDRILIYGPEADHLADVRTPARPGTPRPLIIMIHGGFWRPTIDRTHTGPLAEALAAAGWSVACIEYRRVPGSPQHTLEDVQRALTEIPGLLSGHDERVIVMGHSAGGHLALWAASRRPTPQLIGALALAPAADLQLAHELRLGDGAVAAFVGGDARSHTDLDPRRMPSPAIPTTIVHGEADSIVPSALADSYAAAHPAVRLVKLPGAGHFELIDPQSSHWRAVLAELDRLAL